MTKWKSCTSRCAHRDGPPTKAHFLLLWSRAWHTSWRTSSTRPHAQNCVRVGSFALLAVVGGRSTAPIPGHVLHMCVVDAAFVRPAYWQEGKLFSPPISEAAAGDDSVPPYLTFFGSKRFGAVVPVSSAPASTEAGATA